MATVFERLGDSLYAALYTPNPDERRAAIAGWVTRAVPVISAEIQEELSGYLAWVTAERWSEEGWRRGAGKWRRIQPSYHLTLDIKLRSVTPAERPPVRVADGSEPLVPGSDRPSRHTLFRKSLLESAATFLQAADCAGAAAPNRSAGDTGTVAVDPAVVEEPAWQNDDDGGGSGRSPNDDRSDSMNPNNDAYWSSRGR